MSAVDVLGQVCAISKFKATMALKLSQGGVHFVIFCKKKTNADIESDFQIGYNKIWFIVSDSKIGHNITGPVATDIVANVDLRPNIIGPNVHWLQYPYK